MKAVTISKWGDIHFSTISECTVPEISDQEILVKIHAAGVNPIDYKVCEGRFEELYQNPFPFRLGWDMAGVITKKGSHVTQFQEGDRVFGMIRFPNPAGTFADYIAVNPDEISIVPEKISLEEAASVPLACLTAIQALAECNIKPQQRVLIHAGAGGVGHFAIQLAKLQKAWVATTASQVNHTWLTSLGADQVIDYTTHNFESCLEPVDVVLDGVGGPITSRSLDILKPGGVLVSIPSPLSEEFINKAQTRNVKACSILVQPHKTQLEWIAASLAKGSIKPFISKQYPFQDFLHALQAMKQQKVRGKIVLTMDA